MVLHLARQLLHDFVPGLPHVILILAEVPHFVPGLPHRVERVIVGNVVLRGQTRVPHQWLDCASTAAPPCVPCARGIMF